MIQKIQNTIKTIAPFIIGATILLGSTAVFTDLSYSYANSKSLVIEIGFAVVILMGLLTIPWASLKNVLKSKISISLKVFLLVSLIATIFSIDRSLSWLSHLERGGTGMFFVLLAAVGAFFATMIAYQSNTFRKAILYPLAIASGIIGLSTIVGDTGFNILHISVLGQVSGGGGLTGNSSYAGSFLMMCFFIIMYLFFTTKARGKKILVGILGFLTIFNPVIFGYALFRTGFHSIIGLFGDARGATMSLGLGLLVSLGLYLSFSLKKNVKWLGRIITGGVIVFTALALILLVIPNSPVHDYFVKNDSGARFLYWNIALESAKAHPIIGTGPETYRYAHDYYFNPDFMRKSFLRELWADKPHNAYLEVLDTTGIVGLLAYLVLFGMLIRALVKLSRKSEHKVLVVSLSGLLFAYLLNNFIFFDTPISFLVIFLVMAWLAILERQEAETSVVGERPSQSQMIIGGIIGAAVLISTLAIVIPEIIKLRNVLEEMYAPLETRPAMYERSESASPYGSGVTIAQRGSVYTENYLTHLDEVLASSPESQRQVLADVDALTVALNTALATFPKNIQSYIGLARLASIKISLLNSADPVLIKQMIDAGEQIKILSPRNPQAYWAIGQAYAYEGKFQEAIDAFQAGIAIDPYVPESHQTLIGLAQIMGDKKLLAEATAAYEQDVLPEDK